jgi:hypothetical protein
MAGGAGGTPGPIGSTIGVGVSSSSGSSPVFSSSGDFCGAAPPFSSGVGSSVLADVMFFPWPEVG